MTTQAPSTAPINDPWADKRIYKLYCDLADLDRERKAKVELAVRAVTLAMADLTEKEKAVSLPTELSILRLYERYLDQSRAAGWDAREGTPGAVTWTEARRLYIGLMLDAEIGKCLLDVGCAPFVRRLLDNASKAGKLAYKLGELDGPSYRVLI